jgi:hypothetical protein
MAHFLVRYAKEQIGKISSAVCPLGGRTIVEVWMQSKR